ncbi:MAG: DUF202 domain-containing protein [Marinicaulis sp.]|nr:DUF202 domain-containing protein [Marinicaulis sp.]NNE39938.1 DUF202 domain-containing protein [Marinicaulis sp.]
MSPSSDDLAEKRTDWAEDRTLLANERTYAGWMRTGLASVGLGLGFQAIFKETDPTWAAKAVATIFILIGVAIFWGAWRNARDVQSRLHAHAAQTQSPRRLGLFTILFIAGSLSLTVVLWLL